MIAAVDSPRTSSSRSFTPCASVCHFFWLRGVCLSVGDVSAHSYIYDGPTNQTISYLYLLAYQLEQLRRAPNADGALLPTAALGGFCFARGGGGGGQGGEGGDAIYKGGKGARDLSCPCSCSCSCPCSCCCSCRRRGGVPLLRLWCMGIRRQEGRTAGGDADAAQAEQQLMYGCWGVVRLHDGSCTAHMTGRRSLIANDGRYPRRACVRRGDPAEAP